MGQPTNNWSAWERSGRATPSGPAAGTWGAWERVLDALEQVGADSFRLSFEWARVIPAADGVVDETALATYVWLIDECLARGITPVVTLHHFTHPAWLGPEFWLRPDAPERFASWVSVVVEAVSDRVRHWVTINEPNVLALGSWVLGVFPPGRHGSTDAAALAVDHLLSAHVRAYEIIHAARPDALVTTNVSAMSAYPLGRQLLDLLVARRAHVDEGALDEWFDERARLCDSLLPTNGLAERAARWGVARRPLVRRAEGRPGGARTAVYASEYECTLDVLGLNYYAPRISSHLRLPGHPTAGGRRGRPTRALWDDTPDPAAFGRWLGVEHYLYPELDLWILENGMSSRVTEHGAHQRLDGWRRPRYLSTHLAAILDAIELGVPVAGYWHWSLVDNYEWGSFEPRFGLLGVDRTAPDQPRWTDEDAVGDRSAETYRALLTAVRSGDRAAFDAVVI